VRADRAVRLRQDDDLAHDQPPRRAHERPHHRRRPRRHKRRSRELRRGLATRSNRWACSLTSRSRRTSSPCRDSRLGAGRMQARVEELLSLVGLDAGGYGSSTRASCPVERPSGSGWPGRSPRIPRAADGRAVRSCGSSQQRASPRRVRPHPEGASQDRIFVTHDVDEAIRLADKIAVMKDGRLRQYDTPENVLDHPADKFVHDFMGPTVRSSDSSECAPMPSWTRRLRSPTGRAARRRWRSARRARWTLRVRRRRDGVLEGGSTAVPAVPAAPVGPA